MSDSQNENFKDKPPKVGDVDVSKIHDEVGIHSTSDSTRHLERAQEKKPDVTEANKIGSWQIKEEENR